MMRIRTIFRMLLCLAMAGVFSPARALTEHNLHFYANLMRGAQAAIASGNFKAYSSEVSAGWEESGADASSSRSNADAIDEE